MEKDPDNDAKFEKLKKLFSDGCSCTLGPEGKPCSQQLEAEVALFTLSNALELSHDELDLVILASIQVFTRQVTTGEKRARNSKCNFRFADVRICKEMFLQLHGISNIRFKQLREHFELNGVSPRIHGNSKRCPWNRTPFSTIEEVKNFIDNYVDENAVLLPGRIPGYKNDDIRLLSSCETKAGVWREYCSVCEASEKQAVGFSKFREVWKQFYPNVVVACPRTDLCSVCQENTTKLQRAANYSDLEKSECVKAQQKHLNCAQGEREIYRTACKDAITVCEVGRPNDLEHGACKWNVTMHYSFDYAQQVHIPSNPMQPGPIYFKTPRKCGIFGVMCEGIPQQVNFLIDEASDTGKGANTTISCLHYYFTHHGLGETNVHLHADNCSGQNKNNYFLWYLAWRTLMGLHEDITYSFLIAGLTKFGPDCSFGMIKKAYKLTYISSLYELARMVDSSSTVGVNKAQLVGTHDGRIIVQVFDWVSFLDEYFRKLPNIKKFHHFKFSVRRPGVLIFKEFASSEEREFLLLKNWANLPPQETFPNVISPEGLTEERKRYLYREIRQFCRQGSEDLVALAP